MNDGPAATDIDGDRFGAEPSALAALGSIARSGVLAVLVHPLASCVTVACLVAMLAPFLVGLGLSRGAADQAAAAIDLGGDLYVTGTRFGRAAPLPLSVMPAIRAVPGVQSVEPRIVGATVLGAARLPVVVVGVTDERLSRMTNELDVVVGRLPAPGSVAEVAVGSELAAELHLAPGSAIPPFYRNDSGERITTVVGVFRSDLPAWQAHVMLATFQGAAAIFDEKGTTTGFIATCPEEYRDAARTAILRLPALTDGIAGDVRLRVVSRGDLSVLLARRTHSREADLAMLYALVFSLGVPILLATTGLGVSERRRETALLRALGRRTDEVVLRSLCESALLAVLGASAALLVAWIWVRGFNAAGLAHSFLPDAGVTPEFEMPFRLLPEAMLSAFVIAVTVTSAGSLWSAWRASSAPPTEVLR